jgi:aminoglycoside 2'-N-acetyltransferase I
MAKEIRQTASLSDAERKRLFDWGEDIFGANDLALRWRGKDVHFLLEIDGQVVSHVGILKHQVTVAGQPLTVGGVGGVVTIPEAQHSGYARELLQQAVNLMKEWQVDAGLLFCLKLRVPFYAAQGWQLIAPPVMIQHLDGEVPAPLEVMILPLGRSTWPEGEVRLNSFPW